VIAERGPERVPRPFYLLHLLTRAHFFKCALLALTSVKVCVNHFQPSSSMYKGSVAPFAWFLKVARASIRQQKHRVKSLSTRSAMPSRHPYKGARQVAVATISENMPNEELRVRIFTHLCSLPFKSSDPPYLMRCNGYWALAWSGSPPRFRISSHLFFANHGRPAASVALRLCSHLPVHHIEAASSLIRVQEVK
jgi:hypothetical protein